MYAASIFKLSLNLTQPWTDSTIILGWLRMMPHAISDVFVRNRVSAIQESLPDALWRHVSSRDNPADLASQGSSATSLINSSIWWSGPSWLSCPEVNWPPVKATPLPKSLPGVKGAILTATLTPAEVSTFWIQLWTRYSNYTTLIRIYSWVRRFLINYCCKDPSSRSLAPTLTSLELASSRRSLLLQQQRQAFPEVFAWLRKKKTIPGSHCLAGMVVYLDEHKIIRVTGRVRAESSTMPRQLTPLSLKCHLTRLMVETEHHTQLHPGTSILMSILGHSYYIPGLRFFLKRLSKRCPACQRANARTISQQMGLLPSARTTLSPPFATVGVDFAGPFILRRGHTRKPVMDKAYFCLFICLTTKAIHLEVCATLDTQEFLAAFRRFSNRRGTPFAVYSDNGSNFIGAKTELQAIQRMLRISSESISHLATNKELQWHHIPPRSPHHGGLWEAGVREMKRLMKIIAPHPLRYDEFQDVLISVEASLNSRPLVALGSTEVDTDIALTPGHFLIGRLLRAPPSKPASLGQLSHLRRWQLVQRLQQDLWLAWKGYYLHHLQTRTRWKRGSPDLSVGDVVFLKDATLSSGRWPLARVISVQPGTDGRVRVVEVQCGGSTYRRSVQSLIKLHLDDDMLTFHTVPAETPVSSNKSSETPTAPAAIAMPSIAASATPTFMKIPPPTGILGNQTAPSASLSATPIPVGNQTATPSPRLAPPVCSGSSISQTPARDGI